MFKYLWLMLMLVTSLLQTAAAQPGNNEVNCYREHNEPYACAFDESGMCYWNYGRNFCDTRFNAIECNLAPNYDTCMITIGCAWDNVNHWCDNINNENIL